jgi:hypothetical protein
MLARPKPVVFDPYGRRRSRGRLPRWLVLLLLGMALGIVGVILVQQRYLPPRLSVAESNRLREAYDSADAERVRLKAELDAQSKKLDTTLGGQKTVAEQLAASQATVESLRADLASLVAALPPDPRGGAVEVRAARFSARGRQLGYDLVLTRDRGNGKPWSGVLQFTVAGEGAGGEERTVVLKPIPVTIAGHEVARGEAPMPEGFRPRQTTVQVLDRAGGASLGMRVLPVK